MVAAIGASQSLGAGSLADALGGDESLDKQAFLKLLVAQLQYQDPLEPQENSEFVAQLAQFTSLEQTVGINDRLDMLAIQSQGLANTEVVNLVGKAATVRGQIATLSETGEPVPLRFSLGGPAEKVNITVRDESGRVVRNLELGPHKVGLVTNAIWDGKNDAGVLQPAGRYTIGVSAEAAGEVPVSVTQEVTGIVQSVSYTRGFPELTLDNGLAVPVADLLKVESSPTTK